MTAPSGGVLGTMALPRWQRYSVYVAVAVVGASGISWLLVPAADDAGASNAARAVATWLLRCHGVAAYALLVAVGSILPLHLRLGWSRKRNRWSGGVLVAVLSLLAASGLWLYYGPVGGRGAVSLAHSVVGIALPAWLLLHRTWGLRSRRIGS